MFTFETYLRNTVAQHPSMEPRDVVKFCFQATFGAEHLLLEEEGAWNYFQEEYARTMPTEGPLFETVCDIYSRANLAAWKQQGMPPDWLFRMFFLTASEKSDGTETLLKERLTIAESLIKEGCFAFSLEAWKAFREEYEAEGIRPVHHSQNYRDKEHPAYRIVKNEYIRIVPVLQKMAAVQSPVNVLAMDGCAGAGKSTNAKMIADLTNSSLIYMDDFFLPPELRTKERLEEAGGNVHYERFALEVLPYLRSEEPFSYRCFECSKMDYGQDRIVEKSEWRIVEGSYCCHPALGEYMDLKVFCDVDAEVQMRRILKRNGSAMAKMFAERWIPMEEQYFKATQIKEKSDLVI